MDDDLITFGPIELCLADSDDGRRRLTGSYGFVERTSRPAGGPLLTLGSVDVVLRDIAGDHGAMAHVAAHGDTIVDINLFCPNTHDTIERAREAQLEVSAVGDTFRVDMTGDRTLCHTIGIGPPAHRPPSEPHVDHVAYCLPYGASAPLATTYEYVFGLQRLDVADCAEVGSDVAGMRSVVVRSGTAATIVLTEPAWPHGGGQTLRFIDGHRGPGVQHIAIGVPDICATVAAMRDRGVGFLDAPPGYYAETRRRLAGSRLPWERLEDLQILADADEQGVLLQVFARPLSEAGLFFVEFIERSGATGFGANNVRALFEALETATAVSKESP